MKIVINLHLNETWLEKLDMKLSELKWILALKEKGKEVSGRKPQ